LKNSFTCIEPENYEQLRTDHPVPDNPVALTNNIMHAVTSYEKLKDYKEYDTSNNMLKLAFAPRIRFALLTVIVFVVSLFFIQESLFMGRIAKLEKKISQSTAASIYANEKVKYSTLGSKLLLLGRPRLYSQNYLLSPKDNNNLIIVDEKILNALMVNYKHVKIQNDLLLDLIKNKNPDLYNITIKDGLDQAEIKKLLENKKEILRIINEL